MGSGRQIRRGALSGKRGGAAGRSVESTAVKIQMIIPRLVFYSVVTYVF